MFLFEIGSCCAKYPLYSNYNNNFEFGGFKILVGSLSREVPLNQGQLIP